MTTDRGGADSTQATTICAITNGSRTEPYDRHNVHSVRRILDAGRTDVLHEVADAWGKLSERLGDVDGVLRSQAETAAGAWQGSTSSLAFQRTVRQLRGTVQQLCAVADSMQEMVKQSAGVLDRVKSHFVDSDEHAYNPSTYRNNAHAKESLRQLGEGYEAAVREHLVTQISGPGQQFGDRIEIAGARSPAAVSSQIPTFDGQPEPTIQAPVGGDQHRRSDPRGSALSGQGQAAGDVGRPAGLPSDPGEGFSFPVGGDDAVWSADGRTSLAGFAPSGSTGSGGAAGMTGIGAGGGGFGGASGAGGPGGRWGSGSAAGMSVPGLSRTGSGVGGRAGGTGGLGLGQPGPAGGEDEEESTRRTWLAEDRDVWGGTDLAASPAVLGEPEAEPEPPRRRRRSRSEPER